MLIQIGSQFTVAHELPRRVRLKLNSLSHPKRLQSAAKALKSVAGVESVSLHNEAASLVVEYRPTQISLSALLAIEFPNTERAGPSELLSESTQAATTVSASPRHVWQVLANPRTVASYLPGTLKRLEVIDELNWEVDLELFGRTVTEKLTVVEKIDEERLVLAIEGAIPARITLRLEQEGLLTRVYPGQWSMRCWQVRWEQCWEG